MIKPCKLDGETSILNRGLTDTRVAIESVKLPIHKNGKVAKKLLKFRNSIWPSEIRDNELGYNYNCWERAWDITAGFLPQPSNDSLN